MDTRAVFKCSLRARARVTASIAIKMHNTYDDVVRIPKEVHRVRNLGSKLVCIALQGVELVITEAS